MNSDLIGIFDSCAHLRAILHWGGADFTLESIPGFDITDVEAFLVWLRDHEPRKRFEKNNMIYVKACAQNDPHYLNAVLQELGMQGFLAHSFEEYQKDFLLELNNADFDVIRQNMLGDLFTLHKEDISGFVKDLKEGMDIVGELNELG